MCSCRRIPSSRTEAVHSLPTPTRPAGVCDPAVVAAADQAAAHSATLPTTNLTTLLGGRPPIDRPPTQLHHHHHHLRPPTRLVLAAGHLPSLPIHTRPPQSTSHLHHGKPRSLSRVSNRRRGRVSLQRMWRGMHPRRPQQSLVPLASLLTYVLQILEEGKAFELGMPSLPCPALSSVPGSALRCPTHILPARSLTLSSWQPMAHRLLPLQHLRHPSRLRCESAPPGRRLPDMQQLYIQLQPLRQQDRRPRHSDR